MKELNEMREKLEAWMQGRYGSDELGRALIAAGIICWIIDFALGTGFLLVVAWVFLIVYAWRSLSRDITKRREENERYLEAVKKPKMALNQMRLSWINRKTTLYFRCDGCKTWLSVPCGKGNLRVVCPNCKKEMQKKS